MCVNYLIEIIAMDDWELTHPLSANAYKFMRKLLYLANKERFPERIQVPNTVLMTLIGCSEDSLIRARNQLIQAGLISYKGQKKFTPVYIIHYFSQNPGYNSKFAGIDQGINRGINQGIDHGIDRGINQGTYINKRKEDREEEQERAGEANSDFSGQRDDGEGESALAYFKRCGIAVKDMQFEALREFYESGVSDELLKFAADQAVEYNKLNFAYIRKIVDRWICDGVRTLEEAKEKQARFKEQEEARSTARQAAAPQPAAPAMQFFSERWNNA